MKLINIVIYLFSVLPILHLVLIVLFVLKRSSYKISTKITSFCVLLTLEIIAFLLSLIVPIREGLIYFVSVDIIGMITLSIQYGYLKELKKVEEKVNVSKIHTLWIIFIVIGLLYWLVYYIPIIIHT